MNKFTVIFGTILLSTTTVTFAGIEQINSPQSAQDTAVESTAAVAPNNLVVKQGDMLWDIASQMRPSEKFSVYQVMIALLETNPAAFINGNPNNLIAGASLTLAPSVLATIDRNQAFQRFQQAVASAKQSQPSPRPADQAKPVEQAQQIPQTKPTSESATVSQADALANIKKRIQNELQAEATSIKQTPIAGLYEVTVPPRVFYISENGQYVLTGDMIDLKNSINLSQGVRDNARVASIENIGEENMIVFSPAKVKHTVTIFTDIDCGYCRKLHNEMASYNKLGIKVRYLAYPRAGIGSPSYNKAVTVWCSDDKKQAMTDSKNGKALSPKNCDNPVAKQMALGKGLGVNGTPAIVLANGQIYPGYAPADKLLQVIEQVNATK